MVYETSRSPPVYELLGTLEFTCGNKM